MATQNKNVDPYAALGAVPVAEPKKDPYAALGAVPVKAEEDPYASLGAAPVQEIQEPVPEKPAQISDSEILAIAQKHNLSKEEAEELISVRGFLGNIGTTTDPKEMLKETAGVASETFLFGLPQFIYKKAQTNPNMRAAIDDLNTEIESRKGYLQKGTELFGGFSGALGLSKLAKGAKAAPAIKRYYDAASTIGSGTAMGIADSREGEEVAGAITGAGTGVAALLGAKGIEKAAPVVGKGLKKGWDVVKGKWTEDLLEKSIKEADALAPKVEQRVDQIIETQVPKINATKTVLSDAAETTNMKEFLEVTNPEVRRGMVSPAEVSRLLKDESTVAALKQSLGKDIITSDDIVDSVSYNLFNKAKLMVEELAGGERTLKEIVGESAEFAEKLYERALRNELADGVLTSLKLGDRLKSFSPLQKAALFISDGKFVAKVFDDKLGTQLESVLDQGSKRLNRYTDLIKVPLTKGFQLAKQLRVSKVPTEDLYKQLDSGKLDSDIAVKFSEAFEEVRQLAGKAGINIKKLNGYVPHLRKPIAEYMLAFRQQVDNLTKEVSLDSIAELDKHFFSQAKEASPLLKQLTGELENLGATAIKDGDDFSFMLNRFLKSPSELRAGLNANSFATRQRLGGIPDWALDKNVPRLYSRWIQNTFRYGAIRETVTELKSAAMIADKAGQDDIAKYIRNLNADLLGTRTDTFASQQKQWAERFQITALKKAQEATNPIIRKMWDGAYNSLDVISKIQQQVYPNYLGLNPKSALQNMTSSVFQNTPELGALLGSKYTLTSLVDIAAFAAKGGKLSELLYSEGILPRQWTAEMVEALREGARSNSALGDISRKALDKYTGAMMFLFTKSEIFARGQTYFIGKRLASDMLKDPNLARRVLPRISSSTYRYKFNKALRAGDAQGLEKSVINYLQSTNMFNYDRLNMSDYGRSLGPLFSVFSKWPTATAGKLAHYYINGPDKQAIVRSLQVLAVPYFSLMMVDKLAAPEAGDVPIYDKLVGRKGLRGWTMADSIPTDIGAQEGLMATPIIKAAKDFGSAVVGKEQGPTMTKWINNSIKSFAPGAGAVRFFMEDLPLYKSVVEDLDEGKLKAGRPQEKFNYIGPNSKPAGK